MATGAELGAYILRRSKGSMTGKKLQKLVYYCQAWHLTAFGTDLLSEVPEAWAHGPVYRSLWIKTPYEYSLDSQSMRNMGEVRLPDDAAALVEAVLAFYGPMTQAQLIKRSHDEAPWQEAHGQYQNCPITADSMRRFYAGEVVARHEQPDLAVGRLSYVSAQDMEAIQRELEADDDDPEFLPSLNRARTG